MTSIIQPVPKLPEELSRKLKKFEETATRFRRKEDLIPVPGIEEVLEYFTRPYSIVYLHPPFHSASERQFIPARRESNGAATQQAFTSVSEPNVEDGSFSIGLAVGNVYEYVSEAKYSFAPSFYFNQLSASMVARHMFPEPISSGKTVKITVEVEFPDVSISRASLIQKRSHPDLPFPMLTFTTGRFLVACKSFENGELIRKTKVEEFLWNAGFASVPPGNLKRHITLSLLAYVSAGTAFIDIELSPELIVGCTQRFDFPITGNETYYEFACADFRKPGDQHHLVNASGIGIDVTGPPAGSIKINPIKIEFLSPLVFEGNESI
jgi:hypothetical protein